jgi:hypothetical protein
VIKNNERLSRAVESGEKRALMLEKKIDRKRKYESLVKNCVRL